MGSAEPFDVSSTVPGSVRPDRRSRRRRTRAVVVGTLLTALALGSVGAGIALQGGADESCPKGGPTLEVAAAPEIAPAVAAVARGQSSRRTTATSCLGVRVTAQLPADVVRLAGATPGSRPDVWIPDSSTWTRQLPGAGGVPLAVASVATSPVVLAVPRAAAAARGWPKRHLTLTSVLFPDGHRPVRLALPDPHRLATTVGALLGVQSAADGRTDRRSVVSATVRAALTAAPVDVTHLLSLPAAGKPVAVPVSEQAVWAANAGQAAPRVVAAYLPDRGMALDYPFVVLTRDAARQQAAARLLTAMRGARGQQELQALGFRDQTGRPPAVLDSSSGVDPTVRTRTQVPSAAAVDRALEGMRLLLASVRLLAVIDVSGSMAQQVPGTGKSRMELTTAAAASGLALYPDDADLGLWVFSTKLTPRQDFRQLVPVGPLGVRDDGIRGRERLAGALSGVRAVRGGSTGLYDTTLAAVRALRHGWQRQRVNAVVLLTDGRNEDDHGISLRRLLSTLRREAAGGRPVPVITIAIGPDTDQAVLRTISKVTGGTAYQTSDPRQIDEIFADALSRRPCRPRC